MKKTEKEYLESYDGREGCFAVTAAAVLMVFISSIALNIILLIKLAKVAG